MANSIIENISSKLLLRDFFDIEKIYITAYNTTFSRLLVKSKEAVAILIFNTSNQSFYFVKQIRACKAVLNSDPLLLEIPAGMVESDELPINCAVREVYEEVGFRIDKKKLIEISKSYSAPGILTEFMHIYFVEVHNDMLMGKGGGLDEENENIQVVQIKLDEVKKMLFNGDFDDSKTIMALQWYFLHH